MKVIIGVCGLIGSGKDTVADYLVEKREFKRLSFATALKDACSAIFGWDREMLEGKTNSTRMEREIVDDWWADRLGIPYFSPRYALQYVGTEVFRQHMHEDIWVHAMEKQFAKYDRIVISDVRFPNEIDMLRRNGASMWSIRRSPTPEWVEPIKKILLEYPLDIARKEINTAYPGVHESEWAWAITQFDLDINNNRTLDDLFEIVNKSYTYLAMNKISLDYFINNKFNK